jgi:hypothetical protein
MRLVYYSLANFSYDSRERQWIQSIRSLRQYNRSIPVWLFLFNEATAELLNEAERQDVHVHVVGDYANFLEQAHPRGTVLALYPTFHKFLVLPNLVSNPLSPNLPLPPLTQLLYLDCDTFFFDNVNLIFDRHTEHDLYAREEPFSQRSPYGYDPRHIDEKLLKEIARREGLRCVLPFNSGVCLLNHGVWHKLAAIRDAYLDFAWRLLCGRQEEVHDGSPHEVRVQRAVTEAMTDIDRSRALPYPSANYWIVEQIALWLALGGISDFSLGTIPAAEVAQGIEFEADLRSERRCILAHYFTGAEKDFFSRVSAIAA